MVVPPPQDLRPTAPDCKGSTGDARLRRTRDTDFSNQLALMLAGKVGVAQGLNIAAQEANKALTSSWVEASNEPRVALGDPLAGCRLAAFPRSATPPSYRNSPQS